MTAKLCTLLALALGLGLATTAAQAQTASPLIAAITAIEAKGYKIDDIDNEGSWFDVDALNSKGQWVELIVDASTGEILRERLDD